VSIPVLVLRSQTPMSSSAATAVVAPAAVLHLATQSEPTSVTLSDGSKVYLSLDTAVDVSFSETERRVRILRGEVYFEVAKNPQRPFRVAAADRQVTALGTQFNVRLDEGRVEVVLVAGSVAVEGLPVRSAPVQLRPNQRLIARAGGVESVGDVNARTLTSWHEGWVVFDNTSVAEALPQFNRYSRHPVIADDPQVLALRLSGVFRVAQPGRFAATVQEFLPIAAVKDVQGRTKLVAAPQLQAKSD
jgi:transmembrane sensor